MEEDLLKHIAKIIDWNRTWIALRSIDEFRETATFMRNQMCLSLCRVFTLEIRISLNGFSKGDLIYIPIFKVNEEVKRMALIKDCNLRIQKRSMTYEDINQLFYNASEGLIELGLEA